MCELFATIDKEKSEVIKLYNKVEKEKNIRMKFTNDNFLKKTISILFVYKLQNQKHVCIIELIKVTINKI